MDKLAGGFSLQDSTSVSDGLKVTCLLFFSFYFAKGERAVKDE